MAVQAGPQSTAMPKEFPMLRVLCSVLLAIGLSLSATGSIASEAAATLAIGSKAPDFTLPGVDGKTYKLADFAHAKVLVIVFTCNHCPTAQAYEERIKQLAADDRDKKVTLVAISPNDPKALRLDELGYSDVGDSLDDMKVRAKDRRFTFPYLYDGDTQTVARAYGPVATPHVFVFDQERKLRFAGRVDNSDNPQRVTSHDARNAIDAVLAGKPVPVETTKVFGCSVKWSDKRGSVKQAAERFAKEEVTLELITEKAIKALVANDGKKLRLVNVWATWCGPCVGELSDMIAIRRMYRHRGLELVTISANSPDEKDKALETLRTEGVAAVNYLFDGKDKYALMDGVAKTATGALPHTLLIAPGGKVLYSQSGPCELLALRKAIVDYLGRTYK
jgi:peroxiredoxin